MRFLVDECTGPAVARWLHDRSHEVFSIYEEARGMTFEAQLPDAFVVVTETHVRFGQT